MGSITQACLVNDKCAQWIKLWCPYHCSHHDVIVTSYAANIAALCCCTYAAAHCQVAILAAHCHGALVAVQILANFAVVCHDTITAIHHHAAGTAIYCRATITTA